MSCSSYPKKQNFTLTENNVDIILNPYFSDSSKDYVYKANIEVYDNTFGGIFIVKKISETGHRIVFTTEMGNKLFDFSFNGNDFKVNYILEELDRKILINILEKDFRVLITDNLKILETYNSRSDKDVYKVSINGNTYYYYKKEYLNKIVNTKAGKEKILFRFSKISNNIADEIEVKHNNIKLKINLKSINQLK